AGPRVLGIDPGTRRTGWGVIEPWGPRARVVASGVIAAGDKRPLEKRLRTIHEGLAAVIAEHGPRAVAVEEIFHHKFANAAMKLGHARGVALLAAASADLEVFAYAPSLVKRTVAGRGRADKAQVARLVTAILQLDETPPEDASDALAIALTHVQASRAVGMRARR
ncbi:MAG TPA: crossover junction endodeoxyribonuclease RuvC, partial [Polyangiaceae bacterium LLY-WYZ-15_(1-7)]|nr:crossover junction endodeoxyribonuclease RuvC [Polyangiaceae bacterium LLY-WYZ-15_(1-7)]